MMQTAIELIECHLKAREEGLKNALIILERDQTRNQNNIRGYQADIASYKIALKILRASRTDVSSSVGTETPDK